QLPLISADRTPVGGIEHEDHRLAEQLLERNVLAGRTGQPEVRRRFHCWCASTNQSHLSVPREISVRMSALPASSSSFISSMPTRTVRPNAASASDSAATCCAPVESVNG